MTSNDKQDCIDDIARVLRGTSTWRKVLTLSYPDDLRNERAAERLSQLVSDAANLTDEQWSRLKTAFDSSKWRDGLSQAARQVGFKQRAKDLDAFVKVLVQQFSSVAA